MVSVFVFNNDRNTLGFQILKKKLTAKVKVTPKIKNELLNLTELSQVKIRKMTIGKKIRELREEAKMLQRELAYKLDVGDAYLSKIERNQKNLKKEHLKTISKLFKYPYEELETLWLANKVYDLIKDEKKAIEVLKVAEQEIKFRKTI